MALVSAGPMEAQLVAAVQQHLTLHLYDNAKFLCERLVASFPSEANKLLLGTCYYHAHQAYRAYHLLKGAQGPQARYLFAVCCVELDKHDEAEQALSRTGADLEAAKVPNGAAGYYLLGKIARQGNRHTLAVEHFRSALKADPLMWCAYEELCQMGSGEGALTLLAETEKKFRRNLEPGGGSLADDEASSAAAETPKPKLVPPKGWQSQANPSTAAQIGREGASQSAATPGTSFTTPPSDVKPAAGPPPLQRGGGGGMEPAAVLPSGRTRRSMQHGGMPGRIDSHHGFEHRRKFTGHEHHRRPADDGRFKLRKVSDNLFQDHAEEEDPTPRKQVSAHGARDPSGLRANADLSGQESKLGMADLLHLLVILGEGTRFLADYKCRQAIAAFQRLPKCQYHTAWVLCQVAKAYFEEVDYPAAARVFEQARIKDPCRVEDMEIFSTVLWHMKREIELSYLGQEIIAMDRLCPQAWCVMGNCFSLQKEHETALRLFQRALQIDGNFTYAHTLCGHEYFTNEDFDKSLACYRTAVRIDRRHYNAWYGIGQIYLRQEKYELAENHFRRALTINPGSSVLMCYLGMALHKMGKNDEALEQLQAAISADAHNPLARYEKAQVLQSTDEDAAALKELELLKAMLPLEASVLFQMGKICKKLEDVEQALVHFNMALDLKPPSSDLNLIKNAIEKIHVPEESEEEEI